MVRISHRRRVLQELREHITTLRRLELLSSNTIEDQYEDDSEIDDEMMEDSDQSIDESDDEDGDDEQNDDESTDTNDSDLEDASELEEDDVLNENGSTSLTSLLNNLIRRRTLADRVPYPKRRELIQDLQFWASKGQIQRFRALVRMIPSAFEELACLCQATTAFKTRSGNMKDIQDVRRQLAVALYRLGRHGNASGERDVARACGCSVGSVEKWTDTSIKALTELRSAVVVWPSQEEREEAASWVATKSGCIEWARGWCVMDGTQIKLAWRPALNPVQYFNYKRFYSVNVSLIILPHSLRIIDAVVGFAGSAQDSRVFKSGSLVAQKPRLHLDEGEFIWTDGGYGYSPFTVSPYTSIRAANSTDLKTFNYNLSRIRVRSEHAIAYLKMRFQCLLGYRGNVYRQKDVETMNMTIMACIVAHTVASRHDRPDDIGVYLRDSGTQELQSAIRDLELVSENMIQLEAASVQRRKEAQREYEQEIADTLRRQGEIVLEKQRRVLGTMLREEMHIALFEDMSWSFVDTNQESRLQEKTIDGLQEFRRNVREREAERRRQRRSLLRHGSSISSNVRFSSIHSDAVSHSSRITGTPSSSNRSNAQSSSHHSLTPSLFNE